MKIYQLTIFCACMFMAFTASARSLEIEQVEAMCASVNGDDGDIDVGEFNNYQTGLFVFGIPLSAVDFTHLQDAKGGGRRPIKVKPTSIGSGDKFTACGESVSSNVSCMIGDVDMDGVVYIKDVSALVDYLNNCDNEMRDPFNIQAADVNGDGRISIGDVSALIDKLLAQE